MKKIKHIEQKADWDCGVTALAILARTSHEEAFSALFPRRKFKADGDYRTRLRALTDAAEKFGFRIRGRLIPLESRDWSDVPDKSLVKVPYKGNTWHWCVVEGGFVYDPALKRGMSLSKYADKWPDDRPVAYAPYWPL